MKRLSRSGPAPLTLLFLFASTGSPFARAQGPEAPIVIIKPDPLEDLRVKENALFMNPEQLDALEDRIRNSPGIALELPPDHPYAYAAEALASADNVIKDKNGETMLDRLLAYLRSKLPAWLVGQEKPAPTVSKYVKLDISNTPEAEHMIQSFKGLDIKKSLAAQLEKNTGKQVCTLDTVPEKLAPTLQFHKGCHAEKSAGYISVVGTEFGHVAGKGGKMVLEPSAYAGAKNPGLKINPGKCECSLPFRFDKPRKLDVLLNGHLVHCLTTDIGPWNVDDQYWGRAGCRPLVEAQNKVARERFPDRASRREAERNNRSRVSVLAIDEVEKQRPRPTGNAKKDAQSVKAFAAKQKGLLARATHKYLLKFANDPNNGIAQNGQVPTQVAGLDLTPKCWDDAGVTGTAGEDRSSNSVQWKFSNPQPH